VPEIGHNSQSIVNRYLKEDDFVTRPLTPTPSPARRNSVHQSSTASPRPPIPPQAGTLQGSKIQVYLAQEDDFEHSNAFNDFIKSPMVDMLIEPEDEIYDKYYTLCKLDRGETEYVLPGINKNVQGVTHRNGRLLILFSDGQMWSSRPNNGHAIIESDIHMDDIINFNEVVRGHSDGIMYTLSTVTDGKAHWNPEANTPDNIYHWSVTQDGNHLWIQDASRGYLYDRDMNLITDEPMNKKRIYGENRDIYVNIDTTTGRGTLSFDSVIINDIFDGTFTSDGLVKITSSQKQNGTTSVKNINGSVYYIASKSVIPN